MVVRVILFILLMKENLYVYASGYDAYSSCYRKSRKRPDLPCDFGKQTWCNIPGNSYPWHAVRRFVHENQGLMRRMYGDERHLSVLRAELENNDVEYFDSFAFREEFRRRYSKDMDGARGFVKIFIRGERKKSPESENSGRRTKIQKSIDEKSNNVLYHNLFKKEGDIKSPPFGNKTFFRPLTTSTNAGRTTVQDSTLKPESITLQNDLLRTNFSTTTPNDSTSPQLTSTTMDITTQSEVGQRVTDSNFNYTTITRPNDMEEEIDYSAETEDVMTTTGSDALTTTNEVDFEDEEGQNDRDEAYQDVTEDEEGQNDRDEAYQDVTEDEEAEDEEEGAEEQEPAEEPVSQQAPPMIRLKGINACPVKEEVVAPFWANNTRGEVLALLNLYPFEQYVHWEKCTFEHKQMFCREGCRCEQQYRLHRLLAYDPNNECRGIFSDWFRFPSCCVCKCYDIPMEFRLTSRSPRFKGRDPFVKRPFNMFNGPDTP